MNWYSRINKTTGSHCSSLQFCAVCQSRNDSNWFCVWSDTWQAMHQQHGPASIVMLYTWKASSATKEESIEVLACLGTFFSLAFLTQYVSCSSFSPQYFVNFALGYLIRARIVYAMFVFASYFFIGWKYEHFNQALRAVESSMSADLQAWDLEGPNVTPVTQHIFRTWSWSHRCMFS